MKAEISFDLVMEEDMAFVEGCCRLQDQDWQVFIFRKSRGLEKVGVRKHLVWESGVTGVNIIVPDEAQLNKHVVMTVLASELGVTEWSEIRGPDSMQLR
jgi:hypothetical protein